MLSLTLQIKKTQLVIFRNAFLVSKKKNLKQTNKQMLNSKIGSCVRIKFVSNNIFCTFWSISGKRTFRVRSAGMQNSKISKRRLFFYGKLVLESFFLELQQWRLKFRHTKAPFFYSLQLPKRFRKMILRSHLATAALINFEYSKAFNGCKVKKKRRKKRLGFRSFK